MLSDAPARPGRIRTIVLSLLALASAPLGAQDAGVDFALSREITVFNSHRPLVAVEITRALSREMTIFNSHRPVVDVQIDRALSRELTIFNSHRPLVAVEITRALSREMTIFNSHRPFVGVEVTRALSREVSLFAPVADLGVTSIVAAPEEGLPGRPYALKWRLRNFGAGTARGPWVDRVLLSQDRELGNDELLASSTYDGAPVPPGGFVDRELAFPFPEEPGQHWIIVTTGGGDFPEINRENNVGVDDAPLRVQPPLEPDLVVRDVTGPGEAVAGSTVQISFRVENAAANSTNVRSWVDNVFLTTGASLADSLATEPYPIGSFVNPQALPPGESYDQTVAVTIPERIQGPFHLAVYADSRRSGPWRRGDPFDQVEEDEENNWEFSDSALEIRIPDAQPDLIASQVSPPTLTETGSALSFRVTWNDENAGTAPTGSRDWTDAVYLSTNGAPEIGPEDRLLGKLERSGEALAEGQSDARVFDVVLPADLNGTFHVKVLVDEKDAVWEFGAEGNNVGVSEGQVTVTLNPAIDLAPTMLEVFPPAYPGHLLSVRWRVDNIGAPPLELPYSWRDALYLSVDSSLDPGEDALLGKFARSTERDAGGGLVLQGYDPDESVRLPASTGAGQHFLILFVDAENGVFEGIDNPGPGDDDLKEGNNVIVSAPFDVLLLSTDLAVEPGAAGKPPVPRSGAPGERVELWWTVTNAGTAPTSVASWRDAVFLSEDASLGPGDRQIAGAAHLGHLIEKESYVSGRASTVPLIPPGNYFLLFVADASDDVLELPPGEANNVYPSAFTVTVEAADLTLLGIGAPETATAGEAIEITWTLKNEGSRPTRANLWQDAVYLSEDEELSPEDLRLGSASQLSSLGVDEPAPGRLVGELPPGIRGEFHVIVSADDTDLVYESDETNNVLAAEVVLVEQLPAPNLVVSGVTVTGGLISGQTVEVEWTVVNSGDGPTTAPRWRDSVFLSRDRFLDPQRDIFLGSRIQERVVEPQGGYTDRLTLGIPLGISGPYFVVVSIDRGASNFEDGIVGDNQSFDETIDVAIPEPSDAVVREVSGPASAFLGDDVPVDWVIANEGAVPFEGRWFDSIFLSKDEALDPADVFLGRFESSLDTPLGPRATESFHGAAPLRGATPGDYRLLAQADVSNQIHELQERNNLGVSTGFLRVDARRLVIDGDQIETTLASGEQRYFAIDAPARATVRVILDHASDAAASEVLLRFGEAPTAGDFDLRSGAAGQADQQVTIGDTREGTYYLLAMATGDMTLGETDATLRAVTVPFSVESVSPQRVGDAGRVTLTISGGRLETGDRVFLERDGIQLLEAARVESLDGARLRARFPLGTLERGAYDLTVSKGNGREAVLEGAVSVEALIPPVLEIRQPDPAPLREGAAAGTVELGVRNDGNVDADYLFLLYAFENDGRSEVIEVSAASSFVKNALRRESIRGSALFRALAPGETGTIAARARALQDSEGSLPLVEGMLSLTTEDFLSFSAAAAEVARRALLRGDVALVSAEPEELLPIAQDGDTWRHFWFESLAARGLVDPGDSVRSLGSPSPFEAAPRCVPSSASARPETECAPLEGIVCDEWRERSLELGVAACGGAVAPDAALGLELDCSLEQIPSCRFCATWPVQKAVDPNEKTGGEGTGGEGLVPAGKPIEYRIDFENRSSASAPASVVRITDPLSPFLNTASLRVGDIAFGDLVIHVPEDTVFFQRRLDLRETTDLFLDVVAGVDAATDEMFCILRSIDPATLQPPADATRGFLPPEDGSGSGQGSVRFRVAPSPAASSGIVIRNEASIQFDANEPIRTNVVLHTLDGDAPSSTMTPLPAEVAGRVIDLEWSAPIRSDVAAFTIYVSEDGGPFVPFVTTAEQSGAFVGEPGRTYRFYSRATDHAGNEEPPPGPDDAEATTTIAPSGPSFRRGDPDMNGRIELTDAVRILGHLFLGDPPLPCPDAGDADDNGVLQVTDPIRILGFLFLGGSPPEGPGPFACGADPSEDTLEPCGDPDGACP